MILQNKDGENKIFIDDNLEDHITIYNMDIYEKHIEFEYDRHIEISFSEEKISSPYVQEVHFDMKENKLYFYNDEQLCCCEKTIAEDEIISLSLGEKKNQFQIIEFTTMKLPKFLFEDNYDEKYPKFEVKISDCVYSMRIYTSEFEYTDIPYYQSHNTILTTLDHIFNVIFYLTIGRPDFMDKLYDNNKMDLLINKDSKAVWGCEVSYKIGQEGIYITGGELENYLVEWQKFFKLVMDNTWEVNFYE